MQWQEKKDTLLFSGWVQMIVRKAPVSEPNWSGLNYGWSSQSFKAQYERTDSNEKEGVP